jgi:coproporphyrinogen III oxidase-like Fe-S oxidoreductase
MLAERCISAVLRPLNKRYLETKPTHLRMLPPPEPGRSYVLYAHVPFCERLCVYCSFNRFLYREDRARAYFEDLRTEMKMVADLGYDFDSLYIGGGTPTILVDELARTIDLAKELFPGIKEVSAESSPNHLGPHMVEELSERVQRLSVGVQSFNDGMLLQMDRYTKYGSADEVFEKVSGVAGKFHSLNVDMIFNFPTQTEEILLHDIEMLKATGTNQTTFYPLMASPETRVEMAKTGYNVDFDREYRFFRLIAEKLVPDFEAASAWTFSRDANEMIDEYIVDYEEYVGIGSGALSFLRGGIWENTFSLSGYHDRIMAGEMAVISKGEPYGTKARMRYRFVTDLFGLRLDKKRFKADFGISVDVALLPEISFMKLAGGVAHDDAESITLTEVGRYLLLVMMRETLAASNQHRDVMRSMLPMDERLLLLEGDKACPVPRYEEMPAAAGA